uniref:Uncharacterized protein n=1 Tax=Candidatus Kentrum sp. LFY TaxID=2126342 RepID=A0A450UD95_9GAMM|nr:MAG: hypothetical protein BECKLFY1418B_GA0070995_100553 [Candidatus Kentron sp. LFY]VFJ90308.1 MAG: hypothetical protein BECKLFY1418A_GA0070994_101116 [Candidatus Kentron sp. LFY]
MTQRKSGVSPLPAKFLGYHSLKPSMDRNKPSILTIMDSTKLDLSHVFGDFRKPFHIIHSMRIANREGFSSTRRLATTLHRIGFIIFGAPVRFQLLPSPPRGDAIDLKQGSHGVLRLRDFYPAGESPSRAHWLRPCRVGFLSEGSRKIRD